MKPGQARSLAEALGLGERSFPLVDVQATRGTPTLFATGYASAGSLKGRDALARTMHVALHRGPEGGLPG